MIKKRYAHAISQIAIAIAFVLISLDFPVQTLLFIFWMVLSGMCIWLIESHYHYKRKYPYW